MSRPEIPDKPSFTLREVAELTGFSLKTLEEACRQGRFRHLHLNRQRTMTRPQVEELFEQTEVKPSLRVEFDPEAAAMEEHREKVRRQLAGRTRAAA